MIARETPIAEALALPPTAPAVAALADRIEATPRVLAPVLDALRSSWADGEELDARGFERARDREAEVASLTAADVVTALRFWAERGATVAAGELLRARIIFGAIKRAEARAIETMKRTLGRHGLACDDVDAALVVALAEEGVTLDGAAARAGVKPREARRRLERLAAQRAA